MVESIALSPLLVWCINRDAGAKFQARGTIRRMTAIGSISGKISLSDIQASKITNLNAAPGKRLARRGI
ncbi:MAG TPA: hypothetical protein VIF02_11995 [Methylocella sp.]